MKKYMIFIVACLLCLLISCGGKPLISPPSPNTNDHLPTIVDATLTAVSPEPSPVETTPAQLPNAALFTPTSASKLSLDDYQDREFVGENDIYSIYLINRTGGTQAAPTGELLVFNKSTNQVIKMNGLFTVIIEGGTIVFDDGKGKYVLLSIGTYTSRNAVVLSLDDQKQAVNDFCMSSGQYGDHLFWNDYIIINNCDTFTNRPWGAGEAPGVTSINLKTGTETVIAKSDLTHQYSVKQIEGNTLRYIETYVENEADWLNQDKQKTDEKTYDLTLGPTQVIVFHPAGVPTQERTGSCWSTSNVLNRVDAWRCTAGNSIYDPCFSIPGNSQAVLCDTSPLRDSAGFKLNLTESLPARGTVSPLKSAWALELSDGTNCIFIGGATAAFEGKRVNYSCSDGWFILGELQDGQVWTARKVRLSSDLSSIEESIQATIKIVWI